MLPVTPRSLRPAGPRPAARGPGPTPDAGGHALPRRPAAQQPGSPPTWVWPARSWSRRRPAARRGLARGPPGAGTWVGAAPARCVRRRRRAGASRPRSATPLVPLDAGTPWIDARHDAGWRRAWREVSAATPPRGYHDPRGLPRPARGCSPSASAAPAGWPSTPTTWWSPPAPPPGCGSCWRCCRREPVAVEDPGYRAAVADRARSPAATSSTSRRWSRSPTSRGSARPTSHPPTSTRWAG